MLIERHHYAGERVSEAELSALALRRSVGAELEIGQPAVASEEPASVVNFSIMRLEVTLVALRRASERTMVLRLRFGDEVDFKYRPGQFVGLDAPDGRLRFFSIANADPVHNELELHVNRIPGGIFTGLLFEQAKIGDKLWMEGPFGEFTIPPRASVRTILVAGGTGFAPIKACLEQMAAVRISGSDTDQVIHLYWGARSSEDLYDQESVQALSQRLPGLRFVTVLDAGGENFNNRTGFVHRAVIDDFDDLSDYDIYACGVPAMIEALSRDCVAERGFDPSRLTADVFAVGVQSGSDQLSSTSTPVELRLGEAHQNRAIEGAAGEALLFALKRAGVALPSVCGGKGACGTCRVHVAPEWRSRLTPPAKQEARLLKYVGAAEGERLSCRIELTAGLSGLELQTSVETKGDVL